MASRRPGRYLETFLEPVASFSQSMSPYRATPTPFTPKIMTFSLPATSVNRPISSNGPFYYGSISPSTVLLNLGTPLDLCATPWCVDISSRKNKRIQESRVMQFSVGKHIKTANFRAGHLLDFRYFSEQYIFRKHTSNRFRHNIFYCGTHLAPFGTPWNCFWLSSGRLGAPLGSLWLPLRRLGVPGGSFLENP